MAAAVVLAQGREGNVLDVEVQAHTDGIGRHQVVHIPCLVHRHLGISSPWRERAQHHRRAPVNPTEALGILIDPLGAEGDHRRPPGHGHELGTAR